MISQNIKSFTISLFSSFKFLYFQLKKKRDYVIYSESHNYKLDYIDLIDNLIKKPFITSIITSDLNEFYDLKKNLLLFFNKGCNKDFDRVLSQRLPVTQLKNRTHFLSCCQQTQT